ncbi:hypothetical protein DL768_006643 [Monosporascus sp. mg162]|nr:hypothetical protein DL768_006643 [Monosporascus sp. mg162]
MAMAKLSACDFNRCSVSSSPFADKPSPLASGIFISLFSLSLVGYLAIAATVSRGRWLHFTVPVCIACVFEIIGYGARIASWSDPWGVRWFIVSTAFLTVAPAFVAAGIHITIAKTVPVLGTEHSLVEPSHHEKLLVVDGLGLLLQAAGLAVSFSSPDLDLLVGVGMVGGALVATGLAVQLLALSASGALFGAVLFRASGAARERSHDQAGPGYVALWGTRVKALVAVLAISLVSLSVRGLYAIIAVASGFGVGGLARNEALFTGFDSLMVSQAVVGLVAVHPACFLDGALKARPRAPENGITGYRVESRTNGRGLASLGLIILSTKQCH